MSKSKIHRATVTDANLQYMGSITIDKNLLKIHINKLKIDPDKKAFLKFLLKNDKKTKNINKGSN